MAEEQDSGGKGRYVGKPPKGELGFTGLEIIGGAIQSEYLDALEDLSDRVDEYDHMRSDAACAALMQVIGLPLRGASWEVRPPDDADSTDTEIAEAINQNLMEGMTHTWDDFLRHALLGVFYGFALFEKVWEVRDGEAVWRKFAPRSPATVARWEVDETGGLSGVRQQGYYYDADGTPRYESGQFIPIEKLLLMSWRQEYGNFEGRGLFRDAYRHYWYADKLYTLAGIRVERSACPTPVAGYEDIAGPTLQEAEEEKLQQALARLRTYEEGGIVRPLNIEIEPFEVADAQVPFLDLIQHHHQMILQVGLAQFVGMGQGDNTGTYALSRDASSLFLQSLNATANWVAGYINRYARGHRCARQESLGRNAQGPLGR